MGVRSFNTSFFRIKIMASSKYCPSCGSQNDPHNQFCEGCGETFSVSAPPSSPETSTAEPQVLHESLEVTYASDGDRFVAFVIDSILFGLVGKLFGLMFGLPFFLIGNVSFNFDLVVDNWTVALAAFLYFILFEALNKGQTPGKMALKIKTVDSETLGTITPAQAAINAFGKAVFLGLDIIIGLITREDKSLKEKNTIRIMQRVSKTSIIKIE
jgi:uncharacterized RDD family membrane protein YckC